MKEFTVKVYLHDGLVFEGTMTAKDRTELTDIITNKNTIQFNNAIVKTSKIQMVEIKKEN
ncbi:hypothetical protein OCD85_02760 [Bacillus pacificus]|uniref:Uncharacterized protein n=1 Tax=Bacillus phage J5a TaxID=2767195 RepID=A0A7S6NKL2_9CAUD|nr:MULTISPECIES: hypothetical protein [Bacillus cereus group]YP_010739940.1 hypothetical protein P9C77_gp44 [Bacillus phage J5a]MCC2432626.1 hypothetical protein [Bacillus paranthracis]MCU5359966.1 hypothetical protein [Bacillus pacificus]MCU5402251.1 hypothetical protein [Bacillus pacificus]QOQ37224.1 hypothetical protein J5a_044 [Bacillus phage J5a]